MWNIRTKILTLWSAKNRIPAILVLTCWKCTNAAWIAVKYVIVVKQCDIWPTAKITILWRLNCSGRAVVKLTLCGFLCDQNYDGYDVI